MSQGRAETISVCGEIGAVAEDALRAEGVVLRQEGSILVLEIRDRRRAVAALCKALDGLARSKDVISNNLANRYTTKTAAGTPYRRQFARFDSVGGFEGVGEDGGDYNWVYDPENPDAEREGAKSGYVAKPNINVIQEKTSWSQVDSQQRTVCQVLERLDPTLIIPSWYLAGFSGLGASRLLPQPFNPPQPSCPTHQSAMDKLNCMSLNGVNFNPGSVEFENLEPVDFDPSWLVAQPNRLASGQASVASSLNWLSRASRYSCEQIDNDYGFGLLNALKSESAELGVDWRDAGNLSSELWPEIETILNTQRLPVILAFNGPLSPHKQGHIVMLTEIDGDQVSYADPHTGTLATTTKQALLAAEAHPDGKFVFMPQPKVPPSADDLMEFQAL